MRMDWTCILVVMIALVLSSAVLAVPAAADRDDRGGKWFKDGGKWDKDWDRGKWDKDWDRWHGGYYPAYGYAYPMTYPATYVVFTPAYYGGDQGACYQACVNSGQYSPAQCGQMCYYA